MRFSSFLMMVAAAFTFSPGADGKDTRPGYYIVGNPISFWEDFPLSDIPGSDIGAGIVLQEDLRLEMRLLYMNGTTNEPNDGSGSYIDTSKEEISRSAIKLRVLKILRKTVAGSFSLGYGMSYGTEDTDREESTSSTYSSTASKSTLETKSFTHSLVFAYDYELDKNLSLGFRGSINREKFTGTSKATFASTSTGSDPVSSENEQDLDGLLVYTQMDGLILTIYF